MKRTNKVELTGYTGTDAELVELKNGGKKASFSIATQDNYKNKNGEWVSNTTWHKVIGWGRTAETIMDLVKKGTKVYIDGKIDYRSFEDKEGNKRTFTEIVAYNVELAQPR